MSDPTRTTAAEGLDVEALRSEFPALHQEVGGRPLVYLDSAATSQKPAAVLDAVRRHYAEDCSNVHRGAHALSARATKAYEAARGKIARFLGAPEESSCLFVRGTTEGINLVAQAWARPTLKPGDEILVSWMEHHSNIVPWQIVCEQTGARLVVAPVDDRGRLDLEAFESLLSERTRLVAVVHVSNALGTVNPVRKIVELAHGVGARVLLDGAQAVPHMPVDLRDLDCDFYAFSGHKMLGPTGIGVLYGKAEILEAMPPWQGGGDMIDRVSFEGTTYNVPPHKFEAGTPNIAGTIGLGAAVDWLENVGMDRIAAREAELLAYATERLEAIPDLRLIGTAEEKAAVLSFVLGDVHASDVGTILDKQGIAIRAGHHCTQPLMERYGVPATARASLAFYNTRSEIDALADGLEKCRRLFGLA